MTRGSITGQVKAISMIVAMQNFIPDGPSLRRRNPPLRQPSKKIRSGSQNPSSLPVLRQRRLRPGQSLRRPRQPLGSRATAPYVPLFNSVPDLGVGLSMIKNPFVRPR